MTIALTYIYQIFNEFVDLVFNDMMLFPGVSFGFVFIDILLITAVMKAFIDLPGTIHHINGDTQNERL